MKNLLFATVFALSACGSAFAQAPVQPAPSANHNARAAALCDSCGTVQDVHQEKRKGKGGAVGVVGGAVVGGLVGNQFGKGRGNTLATVGGAVAGGYAGNEVQKHVTSKTVWVTRVRMKDGSIRTFEQQAQPGWRAGSLVKVNGRTLSRL